LPRSRVTGGILGLALALYLGAQTSDTAAIQGHVTDPTHGGIAAVEITVKDPQTGLERKTETDALGDFWLAGLPVAGKYEIVAQKPGFAERRIGDLMLAGGTTANVTIPLSLSGVETEVIVTGSVGEVRADQPQLGTRLSSAQIEETPLPGRKITWLPLLNAANRPAISQGDIFMNQFLFTTNGSGRRQAWFEVDGSTGNDSWGRQTIFSSVPQAAVQEMTLLVNAFSAEYGASTGAVVNLVTRSGANSFHGSVLELWRPAATEAALSGFTNTNATSGNQITSDTLGQSSVALSGPLGGGHTQFSVAAEFSRQDRASPVTSPVAPGSFVGHYRGWLGFFRVDHQFDDRNNLFFRSSMDGFHDTNPNGTVGGNNLPTVDRVFRRRTYSEELGETAVLSPTLVNNVRLQFQLADPITEFDPVISGTQYQVPISTGGTFTTGTSQSALLLNRQYQFNDVVSNVRGRHTLKLGANVIYSHSGGNSKEFGGPIYLGQFVYNPCTQPLTVCESQAFLGNIANVRSYTQSYGNASYTVDDVLWSAFVQDDFRVRPGLVLNLGLRYERQTFTDFHRGFAPRAGFAWTPRADGRTVLRGGFGIYYSQVVDNSQANYALTGPTGVFNYTAAPGQVGFPASVAAAPLAAFPAGAQAPLRSLYICPGDASINQFLPTSTLTGYQSGLLSPYSGQWTFGVERRLRPDWVLSADYVGAHTLRVVRPLDVDPPSPFVRTAPGQARTAQQANCTRPYWVWWYRQNGLACNPNAPTNPQPPYALIQSDVNDGFVTYHALALNLTHNFSRRAFMLASYVWSHTIDNVDPDVPGGNPNDPNFTGNAEKGNAIYDQRHRFVLSGAYAGPWQLTFGGIATLATGLPFNYTTGANNSGDTGGTTDRPVINGVVVVRNAGRGRPIYEVAPFLERSLALRSDRVHLVLRAEAFNLLNHANFVGYSGTYGNGLSPGPGFGQPLTGITAQLPARSLQFLVQVKF